MSTPIEVRRFGRADRDQLTALVNAHIGAVVPNVSVSVQGLLSHLERDPGEYVVDPWVVERVTLVAVTRERIVAAAHLLRYAADERVGATLRDAGEVRWLVVRPEAIEAGETVLAACLAQFVRWGVTRRLADGSLPAPGVYGVPDQWPHIRDLLHRTGFRQEGATEVVFVADVAGLPDGPVVGVRRGVGLNGVRFTARAGDVDAGFIELDTNLDASGRLSRLSTWADVGNFTVAERFRGRGIGTGLLAAAKGWLALGGITRLLDYAGEEEREYAAFLTRRGFTELTRTRRGFSLSLG